MRIRLAALFGEAIELCRLVPFYSVPAASASTFRRLQQTPGSSTRWRATRRTFAEPVRLKTRAGDRLVTTPMGWFWRANKRTNTCDVLPNSRHNRRRNRSQKERRHQFVTTNSIISGKQQLSTNKMYRLTIQVE